MIGLSLDISDEFYYYNRNGPGSNTLNLKMIQETDISLSMFPRLNLMKAKILLEC